MDGVLPLKRAMPEPVKEGAAPPIRLLISDIDGTAVRPDKLLADVTIAAFGRLREAGISATLISARPPSGMVGIAEALQIVHPLAAFNGGTIFTADGRVQSSSRLTPEVARVALALAEVPLIEIWLFTNGRWYVRTADTSHIPRERLAAHVEPTIVADFAELDAQVDKISLVSEDASALLRLENYVRNAIGTEAAISRSQPYFLDITATSANKGQGVEALAQAIGVSLSEIAVIGDMPNDLPMFARAGLSIAMGQAPDDVRSAADHVTGSDMADGLAKAIDRILQQHFETAL
jgi:hypothetical protein